MLKKKETISQKIKKLEERIDRLERSGSSDDCEFTGFGGQ